MRLSLPFASQIGRIVPIIFSLVFVGIGLSVMFFFPAGSSSASMFEQYMPYILGGIFVMVGAGSLLNALRSGSRRNEVERLLERHADAPWKVRPEWRDAEIVSHGTLDRGFMFFALLWNALTWPIAYFVLFEAGGINEGGAVLLVMIFPLIGLGMVGKVVFEYLRMQKFGNTLLTLETMPGRLGERLSGVLETGVAADEAPEEGFVVRVSCYRQYVRYTRDSDGDRKKKVERDLLWRDEDRLTGQAYGGGAHLSVPFTFDLPYDMPPSTAAKVETRKLWEIAVDADVPGIDFSDTIEIPVFPPEDDPGRPPAPGSSNSARTASPSTDHAPAEGDGAPSVDSLVPDAAEQIDASRPIEDDWDFDEPITDGIRIDDRPGSFELHFGSSRNRGQSLILGAIGLAMTVGGLFLFGASFLFAIIMVGLGGLMVYGSIQQLTNDTVVRIQDGQIDVTHDGMGMPDDVSFPVEALERVLVRVDGQSENASYGLFLVAKESANLSALKNKAKKADDVLSNLGVQGDNPARQQMADGMEQPHVRVAGNLTDKAEADWLAHQIEEAATREASF